MDFDIQKAVGNRRYQAVAVLFAVLTVVQLISAPAPLDASTKLAVPSQPALVASPSDPFMVEAIRLVQLPHEEDGPWGGAARKEGPKATIQMPGGPITLTIKQIDDANMMYPQIKAHPKVLDGSH